MNNSTPALGTVSRSGAAARMQPSLETQVLHCSFCGLGEGEVERLFEGRAGYICNECVEVCVQLLDDYRALGCKPPSLKVPWYKRWFGSESAKMTHCSFCGAAQSDGEWLLASLQTQICEKCIKACEAIKSGMVFGGMGV
jgi:hypothetical protein